MRTKRFLSLVLAVAMLAAMTISASAAGTLYYKQAFDYADAAAFIEAELGTTIAGQVFTTPTTADFLAAKEAESKQIWSITSSAGSIDAGRSEIWTAANGVKMFGQQRNGGDYGATYYAFDNEWDMWSHKDEILVLSMDMTTEGPENLTGGNTDYQAVAFMSRSAAAGDGTYTSDTIPLAGLNQSKYVAPVEDDPATDADETVAEVPSVFNYTFYPAIHQGTGVVNKTFATNQIARIASGIWCNPDVASESVATTVRRHTFDGTKVADDRSTSLSEAANKPGQTVMSGLKLHNRGAYRMSYGNIRVYAIKKAEGSFNLSIDNNENLSAATNKVTVKFSQPVSPATFSSAVTVTENGTPMEASAYSVGTLREVVAGNEIWSEVDVFFNDKLEVASEYEITLADTISNEMLMTLGANNTVSFTTATPDITVGSFSIVKGWGSDAETTATAFAADGTLQGAALAIKNNTDAVKNVAVIYAVYGSNGQLTDVVYSNGSVAGKATASVDAGVKLSATGSVKAFVWDGISSLKPHTEATVKAIN